MSGVIILKKYGIYKIHYYEDENTKYIEEVKVISCYAYWSAGTKEPLKTSIVVELINSGSKVITLLEKDNNWVEGSKVEVYDKKFIRSDKDATEENNLENLPKY